MKISAYISVCELIELVRKKEITSDQVLDLVLSGFSEHDKQLGSALEIFDKNTILQASQSEGPLAGVPILIKDNIAQKGRKLTCASKILEDFVSPYDATVIEKLKVAGALLVGRANMDEFAMGSSNEHSAYFKCANPWDIERVPGGSSGGSIAAVAAGLVPCALGSDTGGSVRLPASWCNVVGLKPTYGRVSRYGLVAYGSSLDQVSVATRTVLDNATVFSVIAGEDSRDATSVPLGQVDYTAGLDGQLPRGFKLGIIENMLYAEGMRPDVRARIEDAIKEFEKLGATTVKIQIPELDYSLAAYSIISRAEAASNLARFDGVRYGHRAAKSPALEAMYRKSRGEGFGYEQKLRSFVGNYVLSAGYADEYYHNAQKVREMIAQAVEDAFKTVDVLLTPVHAAPAFKFGTCPDPLAMDLIDVYTVFVNMAHVPALAVPCGFTDEELPTGFQLVGPKLSEAMLYKAAYAYEQRTPWHTMHPKQFV